VDTCFSHLSEEEYDQIWKRVYTELQFHPSIQQFITPFRVPAPWAVHSLPYEPIDEQRERFEDVVRQALASCMGEDPWCYALDWHHSCFRYDPRQPQEGYSLWVEDERYFGRDYDACFPDFYPDGDYYFFIQRDLKWGYLGHPWRRELWLYGALLVETLSPKLESLGFPIKKKTASLRKNKKEETIC